MSKFLFYLALLLMVGTTILGYFNERHFNYIISSQDAIIQEQHDNNARVEKELKELKDTLGNQSADQEKNQKELQDAKEAQAKAANDLAQVQKQLADKETELGLLNKDLSVKTARVQELEAALQLLSQPEETTPKPKTGKGKAGRTEVKKEISKNDHAIPSLEGKVLAVNDTYHFVVINLGSHDGMAAGMEVSLKRQGQVIAKGKVTSVEVSTSVADLVLNSIAAGVTVEAGDQVSISEQEIGK